MVAFAISAIENDYEREFMIKLYNKYYSVSKNRAFAILHDFDAVEEVVQDAFVKLIEHLPTIMTLEENAVPAYVIATVKNTTIDYFRKRNTENASMYSFDEGICAGTLADTSPLPEDLYLQQEKIDELSSVLNKLPEKYRILLEAKYILGQSDKEIGKTLGISENSVRMYLTRARRKAYELMKGGIPYGAK